MRTKIKFSSPRLQFYLCLCIFFSSWRTFQPHKLCRGPFSSPLELLFVINPSYPDQISRGFTGSVNFPPSRRIFPLRLLILTWYVLVDLGGTSENSPVGFFRVSKRSWVFGAHPIVDAGCVCLILNDITRTFGANVAERKTRWFFLPLAWFITRILSLKISFGFIRVRGVLK